MGKVFGVLLGIIVAAGVAGALALQYVSQVPATRAIVELVRHRRINPPPMGQTGLGFRNPPVPDSFGPVGPTDAAGPACYDADGRPLSREDATAPEALCAKPGAIVPVSDSGGLLAALGIARAGQVITLAPGDYELSGNGVKLGGVGAAFAPVVVRAARLGEVRLHLTTLEGFTVDKPYWVFENLVITGNCTDDKDCEHAFHVTGPASATIIRNNRIKNFNAAIKVNRTEAGIPDDLLIERNLIFNVRPRETTRPVTPVDVVAADRVHLVANVIADFAKNGGDRTSYGAFAKGGGTGALFERNLILCEWRHRGGNRIGLSLGGGGTDPGLCREGQCSFEQRGGIVRANIVANCSDAGVYLRHAAASRVENNLIVGTKGLEGRFGDTNATIINNIIDGRLMDWSGASFSASGNLTSRWRAALLSRVSDGLFADSHHGDFAFSNPADREARGVALGAPARDFCGRSMDSARPPVGPIEQGRGSSCADGIQGLR